MKNIRVRSLVLLVSISTFFLSACDQKVSVSPEQESVETHSLDPAYGKPGAPISIEYSLPLRIEIGQTINVSLELRTTTRSGKMVISLNTGPSLILLGEKHSHAAIDSTATGYTSVRQNVQIETTSAGIAYLNIAASEFDTNNNALMSRAFAVPIQVGGIKATAEMPTLGTKTKSGDENIIEMVAE